MWMGRARPVPPSLGSWTSSLAPRPVTDPLLSLRGLVSHSVGVTSVLGVRRVSGARGVGEVCPTPKTGVRTVRNGVRALTEWYGRGVGRVLDREWHPPLETVQWVEDSELKE